MSEEHKTASKRGPPEAGTLLYMSPQMLRGEPACCSDDMWSLGVIFYVILTGRFPFSTNDDQRFGQLSAKGLLERDVQAHLDCLACSPQAHDLAARLLCADAGPRITAEAALQHPFFAGVQRSLAVESLGPEEVYRRCDGFLRGGRLRQLAAAARVRLAEGDEERARATFLALDQEGRGSISSTDLSNFFAAGGRRVPDHWPLELGYTALAAATLDDVSTLKDERLCHAVFDLLDADHDGVVSAEDLKCQLGLTREDSSQMIAEALTEVGVIARPKPGIQWPEFLHLVQLRHDSAEMAAA